jgi:hypothetical protein
MALTQIKRSSTTEAQPRVWAAKAGVTIYEGAVVGRYPSGSSQGYIDNMGADPSLIVVGVARHNCGTAPAGYTGPSFNATTIVDEMIWPMDFSTNSDSSTAARGSLVYAIDESKASMTPAGFGPIGALWESDSSTSARVAVGPSYVAQAIADSGSSGGATQDLTVRAVITALAAYAGAGTGTLTASSTGAIGAQDTNVTLAAGDLVLVPQYSGTANSSVAVAAADAGPYEVVSPGGTGVKFVLRRPPGWAHGATIKPESKVRVGHEGALYGGTVWTAGPATATKVVGTDDAKLFPDKLSQQVQLTSSTVTISNEPIRSDSAVAVVCNLVTASSATSTVAYGPIVAPTGGNIGAASLVVDAIASGGTKNGTSDGSTINVTVINS